MKNYEIASPDGNIVVRVEAADRLQWSVWHKGAPVLAPSPLALRLAGGEALGERATVEGSEVTQVDTEFKATNYRKAVVRDRHANLLLRCAGGFSVEFRVFNDAAAYRFHTQREGEFVIAGEEANFNFTGDHPAFIPYVRPYREEYPFNASFESPYVEQKLSDFTPGAMSLLPLLVALDGGRKAVLLEADLEDYPGLYLTRNGTGSGFQGLHAAYPLEAGLVGTPINYTPTRRADYIARTAGPRTFPWRAVVISEADHELLNNDIVQKLAAPSRIADASWVVPGQAAWDWWSDYSLTQVDFKAGVNTPTFKYHIDFAAENRVKYIVIDAGWSDAADLHKLNPEVDLPAIVAYGKERDVGVILWASWYAVMRQMREVFPKYARMGVKGWKIDFIDRDDQLAVASTYEIAQFAAEHRLLIDYHGVFKPTGLQRTYPNVVGYEGVYGLEHFKWDDVDMDALRYAVTIPFTRNLAGPMDYTSGAMINATQADFKARNHAPMSKGTRCNQLAQYVVFEVPLQMLSDSPTMYRNEQECADFIVSIPTVFDECVPLAGQVGEYVAIARRKGGVWYIGAMSNWTARDLDLDLGFLGKGSHQVVMFCDGVNADRDATDYKREVRQVSSGDRLQLHLAPGGGWAARMVPLTPERGLRS